jgi:hypothetical protein
MIGGGLALLFNLGREGLVGIREKWLEAVSSEIEGAREQLVESKRAGIAELERDSTFWKKQYLVLAVVTLALMVVLVILSLIWLALFLTGALDAMSSISAPWGQTSILTLTCIGVWTLILVCGFIGAATALSRRFGPPST